jgi:HlyD family secretion protein
VRDAASSLETAKLSLAKLKEAASGLTLVQAENTVTSAVNALAKLKISQGIDLAKAEQAKQTASDNIAKGYEDALNDISNVFLNLPATMTGLDDVLHGTAISAAEITVAKNQNNSDVLYNTINFQDQLKIQFFQHSAEADYLTAKAKYDKNFTDYKNTSLYADHSTIEALLAETLDTIKSAAESAKSESNYLDSWVESRTNHAQTVFNSVEDYQSDLDGYIGSVNGHLSALLSAQSALANNDNALVNTTNSLNQLIANNPLDLAASEASLKEKQTSLANLKAGADPFDLRSAELTVTQRQEALYDASQKLADYTVRAPFAGVLAKVSAVRGDTASSGTALATIVTPQQIATISLNEVDVAKVKVSQKVTLTFDAIDGLNLTGTVAEIDAIGTVTQGVVTYNVKIVFDTQDARVKSGMSASATIITDIKQDVLLVPSSAVKTSGNVSYVEMPNETLTADEQAAGNQGILLQSAPLQQVVEVGTSNDTSTEITSGLKEGDLIITRTIATGGTAAAASGTNLLQQLQGGSRAGGGATRAIGGGTFGR